MAHNLVSPLALYLVGPSRRDLASKLIGPSAAGAETLPQVYRKARELSRHLKEQAPLLAWDRVPQDA